VATIGRGALTREEAVEFTPSYSHALEHVHRSSVQMFPVAPGANGQRPVRPACLVCWTPAAVPRGHLQAPSLGIVNARRVPIRASAPSPRCTSPTPDSDVPFRCVGKRGPADSELDIAADEFSSPAPRLLAFERTTECSGQRAGQRRCPFLELRMISLKSFDESVGRTVHIGRLWFQKRERKVDLIRTRCNCAPAPFRLASGRTLHRRVALDASPSPPLHREVRHALGETNEVTSIFASPVSDSASMSSTFRSVGTNCGSVCRPSRATTSCIGMLHLASQMALHSLRRQLPFCCTMGCSTAAVCRQARAYRFDVTCVAKSLGTIQEPGAVPSFNRTCRICREPGTARRGAMSAML